MMDKKFIDNPIIAYEELKKQNTLFREELKTYHCREAFGNRCTCAFKRLGNKFCISAEERIAELKAENEKLKSQIKDLQIRKDRYYLNGLEQERQISDYITLLQEIKDIVKECITCGYCGSCKYFEDCNIDLDAAALGVCKMILELITKAEEE